MKKKLSQLLKNIMNVTPHFSYCDEFNPPLHPNIKALWIDSVSLNGKKTKVFAYLGFPSLTDKSNPVPAVILNHGGMGFAFYEWVQLWNERGYAAIAIANTGYYPKQFGMKNSLDAANWCHDLDSYLTWCKTHYEKTSNNNILTDTWSLPPDNTFSLTATEDIENTWMYHALSQIIITNNLLRNDPRIDSSKIGIIGVSWGSFLTTSVLCHDKRFAFAIPVYGSGYLKNGKGVFKNNFECEKAVDLWDITSELKYVNLPILWICWTKDGFFSINSNAQSCKDTPNGILSIIMNMGHGHTEPWSQQEIYKFADAICFQKPMLTHCIQQPAANSHHIHFSLYVADDVQSLSGNICYLEHELSYKNLNMNCPENPSGENWHIQPLEINNVHVSASIPNSAHLYYIEIISNCIDGHQYRTATDLVSL